MAFKGDDSALMAARNQIRHGFDSERNIQPTAEDLEQKIQHVRDIATILRTNVVQAAQDDQDPSKLGMFGVLSRSRKDLTLVVNIHNETELGDNDSIKKKGRRNTLTSGARSSECCSSK
jgi:complex III assembly factor LYRM7